MIIDYNDDILKHWKQSGMNLTIQARPGNGKTNKAKEVMNEMISLGYSILLLTDELPSWVHGLNKDRKTCVAPYEAVRDMSFKTDLLVIDNHYLVMDDFPIEKIQYKHILILSDESWRIPKFFNGEVVRIINWENIDRTLLNDKTDTVYKVSSNSALRDENKHITLSIEDDEGRTELTFPVETIRRLLLK